MSTWRLPLSILLTGLLSAPALSSTPSDTADGRWSLALTGGLGMGHRTLKATGTDDHLGGIVKDRDKIEKSDVAYGLRAAVGYRLGQHTGLELGLGWLHTGWRLHVPMVSVEGSDPLLGETADNRIGFNYLELPVGFTFEAGRGRLRSTSGIGVAPALLMSAPQLIDMNFSNGRTVHTEQDKKEDYESFNLFAYVRTGVSYRISDRITGLLTPTFRYGMLSIVDADIRGELYLWSVDIGLRVDL